MLVIGTALLGMRSGFSLALKSLEKMLYFVFSDWMLNNTLKLWASTGCQRKSAPLWPDDILIQYSVDWLLFQTNGASGKCRTWGIWAKVAQPKQLVLRLWCLCKSCLLPWICCLMHHKFTRGVWAFMVNFWSSQWMQVVALAHRIQNMQSSSRSQKVKFCVFCECMYECFLPFHLQTVAGF